MFQAPQAVDGGTFCDRREPRRGRVQRVASRCIRHALMQMPFHERVLDDVLGVRAHAENPVSQRKQPRARRLEEGELRCVAIDIRITSHAGFPH
jgi:hypothetical protein